MSDSLERALLTAGVVAVVVVALLAMRAGWRRRARGQADLPVPSDAPLPGVPEAPAEAPAADATIRLGPEPGRYLATTTSGDWLDRVVVHGLGVPSRAELTVRDDGVLVTRTGARDLFVPRDDVVGARLDRGIAGAVYEDGGLAVLTWRLGGRELDTGFRSDHPDDHDALVAAIGSLARPATPASGGAA